MPADTPLVAARRIALREWIDTHYAGKQAAFIAVAKINQGELSGLLQSKSFGEKKAAKLERASKMPDGYLVNPLAIAQVAAKPTHGTDWVGQEWGGQKPLKKAQAHLWEQILLHLDGLPDRVCEDLADLIIHVANSETELAEMHTALKNAKTRIKARIG